MQGIDYIYNLQGWLKGINGNNRLPAFDPGGDGRAGANPYVAADAIALTLRYFTNDYKAINTAAPNLFPNYTSRLTAGTYKPLYNGNISATTVFAEGLVNTQLYNYQYDQLNRLIAMDTYRNFNSAGNHWNTMAEVFYYKERYSYDANGNILTATRRGNLVANQLMDSLYYHYLPNSNKLEYVDDYAPNSYGNDVDMKDQSANNYQYDAIGNLKKNVNRLTNNINWNVYGKIVEIQKEPLSNAGSRHLYYNYDPSGNRIGESQRFRTFNFTYNFTWYVRDAQGNVLAVYKIDETTGASAGTLKLAEHHMYGSSRLGIINRDLDADQPKHTAENIDQLGNAYLINFNRGNKLFEVANHLGNVMLTVTDKRTPVPVSGNPTQVASYEADVISAADYSPFGMTLPARVYNHHWNKYRYGFNGKEVNKEVYGPYNELDYGFRIYDPRLGRFLSVDPLTSKYPMLTPYQYASNSPVSGVDLDGLEYVFYGLLKGKDGNVGLYKASEKDVVYQVNFIGTTHTGSKVNIPQKFSLSKLGIKERFVSDGTEVYHIPEGYDMGDAFPPPGDPAWAAFTKYEQYKQDFLERGNYYLDNVEYIADIVQMAPVGGNLNSSKNFRARMGFAKEEANAVKRSGWQLGKNDIDLRGKSKDFNEALDDAFKKTGVGKDEFKVTKWGKNKYGKSIPVEYRSSNGAEVNVDFGHTTDGPGMPHIGWQTAGKRTSGGGARGHILLDEVPAGRSDKKP